jgi:hypothetical protein
VNLCNWEMLEPEMGLIIDPEHEVPNLDNVWTNPRLRGLNWLMLVRWRV